MNTSLIARLIAGGASAAMTFLIVGSQLGLAWHYTVPDGAILASNQDPGPRAAATRGAPGTIAHGPQAVAGGDRT